METTLTIQQVSTETGLSIDTLRYYERIGLIERVNRADNGHRRYTQNDIEWIRLLIRLRKTGMSIARMIHFSELRRQGPSTVTQRRMLLEEHQHCLEEQMKELEQHMAALHKKIAHYQEREVRQEQEHKAQETVSSLSTRC
ncbi:MerR family transcriptional regulator [Ktedonosporobacter rubrisoli]|uniref:MerR family transcriptional regulator n=1 Tax=Ktedonosporobacter rubrisoli TaxID=2509675 RepID=A0A4P6JLG2_KTERU|nr:MerR family transcriptional regulator [Ktedonosporobacter rubrisoli]